MILSIILALLIQPGTPPAKSHEDVVTFAKRAVVASGVNPDESECARFEITKRVAILLSSEGAGLLAKPTGNNCEGYAVDVIIYEDGSLFDILGAGQEGSNTPHWMKLDSVDPSRWRPALSLPTQQPSNTTTGPTEKLDIGPILAKLDQISYQIEQLQKKEIEDTEKIQQQIDQVVKNAEKSAPSVLTKLVQLITLGLAAGAVAK